MVVTNHIDPKIIDRFVWSASNSEKSQPFDIYFGCHSNPNEPFRKTTILNDILREILPTHTYIIQTDIDMLIPFGLINMTMENLKSSNTCYHCNYRYVEDKEVDQWKRCGYQTIPWVEIQKRKLFCASGSWNGMDNLTWRRSNGFCEAIYYLGGPDTEFYRRSIQQGIVWRQDNAQALAHINHKRRSVPKQGKKNLTMSKRYPKDYNWIYRRMDGVSETTITKIKVNQ